jgi:spermidine/putrescine transport system substrate-binding protein
MAEHFSRRMTRRSVLQSGVALGLAVTGFGAIGCGSDGGESEAANVAPTVKPKADGDITWYTWEQYVDPEVLKAFEREYGVRVKQAFFDSDDTMVQKLAAGLEYDLITTNSAYNPRLLKGGLLQPYDWADLKNAGEIIPFFQNPWYDNGEHRYSVPYGAGPAGIIYRKDKVQVSESWSDFWNPQAKGKIFVIDQIDETLGMSLMRNGHKANSGDPEEVKRATDELLKLKPLLGGVSSDAEGDLMSGNSWMSHAWNGSAFQVLTKAKNPENYDFFFPKEGVCFGCDTLSIGKKAKAPGTALLLIDWMLRPENSAKNVQYTGYPNGTKVGESTYADMVKEHPFLALGEDVYENAEWKESATGERLNLWNQQWARFKA